MNKYLGLAVIRDNESINGVKYEIHNLIAGNAHKASQLLTHVYDKDLVDWAVINPNSLQTIKEKESIDPNILPLIVDLSQE